MEFGEASGEGDGCGLLNERVFREETFGRELLGEDGGEDVLDDVVERRRSGSEGLEGGSAGSRRDGGGGRGGHPEGSDWDGEGDDGGEVGGGDEESRRESRIEGDS